MRRLSLRTWMVLAVVGGVLLVLLADRFTADRSGPARPLAVSPGAAASAALGGPAQPSSDDGVNEPGPVATRATAADDSVTDDSAADAPVLVDPAYSPATQEAAAQFAAVWLNKSGKTAAQWRAGLTELVTKAEAGDLAYADPDSVPVGAKVGEPIPVAADGDLWRAGVPVVTVAAAPKPVGVLSLALVRSGGRWLVAEIDWQGAR